MKKETWWKAETKCPKCGYKFWAKVIRKFEVDVCPMCGQELKIDWKPVTNFVSWSEGDLFRFEVL